MAIDFPASPSLNDTFSSGGVTYTWDGTVWVASGSAAFLVAADTDTDDISEGTTNLYSQWDAATGGINYASGNVGIGTTTPAVELDVNGEIRASTGVLFGTDTAAANTLDDYEEGTFTPTMPGVTVYALQNGHYTKVGNMVYFTVRLQPSTYTLSSAAWEINGLPFTASNSDGNYGGAFRSYGRNLFSSNADQPTNFHMDLNNNRIIAKVSASGGANVAINNSNFVSYGEFFILQGFYRVA